MTDFICTFSEDALCLPETQLKRVRAMPGHSFYAAMVSNGIDTAERVLIAVQVKRRRSDTESTEYWACRVTGTLFNKDTGVALSSSRIFITEAPHPITKGIRLPAKEKQKPIAFRIVRQAA